jgi:hypothetical protein
MRCTIKTQEKSTSASASGRQQMDFHPPSLQQFFLNLSLKLTVKPYRMKILQAKRPNYQDFSHPRTQGPDLSPIV